MVAATAGVPEHERGLAAGIVNMAMELGPTVGLALLVSLAGIHTAREAAAGLDHLQAAAAGYGFALRVGGLVFLAAALAVSSLMGRGKLIPYPESDEEEVEG